MARKRERYRNRWLEREWREEGKKEIKWREGTVK